jgi:hypothetical protein
MLGQILLVHVKDEAVIDRERQYIDAVKLDLIGRMEDAMGRRRGYCIPSSLM